MSAMACWISSWLICSPAIRSLLGRKYHPGGHAWFDSSIRVIEHGFHFQQPASRVNNGSHIGHLSSELLRRFARGHFNLNLLSQLQLVTEPGLYIGYRVETIDGAPGDDSGDGLALNLGIDIRLRFENNWAVFIEPGFITQPDGGSDDADVTWSPIGVFVLGVAYSF